jgi:meso-butanediol dehydrogenase/(S,S)-butanediol dehydrogenase/diacetyl reductase
MSDRFAGKRVLVTGGRSGIGAACAARFADEGARVVTAQRGSSLGLPAIEADFTKSGAGEATINQAVANMGGLDILVNNAGMMREALARDTTDEDWAMTLQVNLTAPFQLIRAALPHLIAAKGAIVNVGSIEGLGSNPGHAAYCASKAGLHGLTRAVAVDHGPDGVRCNAVAPGWIDTPLNEGFIDSMPDPADFRRKIGGIHPVGKTGSPADVAALVAFLASDDAEFITGQIYTVDGGRMAQLSLP